MGFSASTAVGTSPGSRGCPVEAHRIKAVRPFLFSFLLAAGFVLAPAVPARGGVADPVEEAIRRGVEYLVRMQRLDGTWCSYGHHWDLGQTALGALALRKAGLKGNHPAILKALNFLKCHPPTRTYDLAVFLMLIRAVDTPPEYRDWVERCGTMLLETQRNGLWSYPKGGLDLSNTQYATLGLDAAAACGFRVPRKTWEKLLEAVEGMRTEDGGWSYRRGGKATGSMTCAGLTCVLFCKRHLEKPRGRFPESRRIAALLDSGLAWMERNFRPDKNPKPGQENKSPRWTYYYLYGVERVGTLSRRQTFGSHDWYAEGRDWLLPRQGGRGQWASAYGESEMNTAFALLFLSRATLGARTKGGFQTRIVSESGGKGKAIVIGCDRKNPGHVWIQSWSKDTARKFGIDGGERAIRVKRVEYYAGEELLGTVEEDPTGNRITRYPLAYRFEKNGTYELRAKVTCVSRHGTIVQTLESGKIALFVHDNFTEEDRGLMADVVENRVSGMEHEVLASSQWDGGHAPARAVDGYQGTSWLSAKPEEDGAPWIRIRFERSVRANLLKVTHVLEAPFEPERFGRAVKIRVLVNRGAEDVVAELGADATKKYAVPLRTIQVRELKIEMLDRVPGKRSAAAGFAEIELFYAKGRKP